MNTRTVVSRLGKSSQRRNLDNNAYRKRLRLGFELLEDRRLLASDTAPLVDINFGGNSSNPSGLVEVGGTVFFTAETVDYGVELWKTDGTAAGTVMVKDIFPGVSSSSPKNLTNVDGTLYFSADDGTHGSELWKSDGTETGTVLVKDVRTGAARSEIRDILGINGLIYFVAQDGVHGEELWTSNGTTAGTVLLKDIWPGGTFSTPKELTNVNGTLFFRAQDPTNSTELWKSDGTEAGTTLVKDIRVGSSGSLPRDFTNVNGKLYFFANDGLTGTGLWTSDGTELGTQLITNVNALAVDSLTEVNGNLFFVASDVDHGFELWKSDLTAAGTAMVKDIYAGATTSNPSSLTNVDGELYFTARTGAAGVELWKSDGSELGTVMVKDLRPGLGLGSDPSNLTNINGILFFSANDGVNGIEAWKTDGSNNGTVLVQNIASDGDSSSPSSFLAANNKLFLAATTATYGRELYTLSLGAPPNYLALSPSSVDENAPIGITIGNLLSLDPDPGDSFTYSLVAGEGDSDNASFAIDGSTLRSAAVFDFETKSSYSIRVRTTDSNGLFLEQAFTITINDLDDVAPSITSVSPSLANGILSAGTTSVTISFSELIIGGSVAGNFELRRQGPDGILGSDDDGLIALTASYASQTSMLSFDALDEGVYRFTISDAITDLPGISLDGDGDGASGGAFTRDFVVDSTSGLTPLITVPTGNGQLNAQFGTEVAIDGNLRVVAAPYADINGVADVGIAFVYDATTGELLSTLRNPSPHANGQFGYSVDISGTRVVVGAPYDDTSGVDAGAVYAFDALTGDLLFVRSNPSPTAAGDLFGYDVSIDGTMFAVGAQTADVSGLINAGRAYVFSATDGALVSTLEKNSPTAADFFGSRVAISGNQVVVGSPIDDAGTVDTGAAYVFNATSGAQTRTLLNPTPGSGDRFGYFVAIDGNYIVVGANNDDDPVSNSGVAYLYQGTSTTPLRTYKNPSPGANDFFGRSVAISGDLIAISAPQDDAGGTDSGFIYVYSISSGSTSPQKSIANPTPAAGDYFGWSVDISGTRVIAGAQFDDTNATDSGAAYVFDTSTGDRVETLVDATPGIGDEYGTSVAGFGNMVVIGTPLDDTGAFDAGLVYVRDATSGALIHKIANPNPSASSYFGQSVAVSEDFIVVGAPYDDTGSTNAGRVYLFDRLTGDFLRFINNPAPGTDDWFGSRVAISGNTVVVGGYNDSNALGVSGTVSGSGAVYLFDATTGARTQTLVRPTTRVASDAFGVSIAIDGDLVVVGASLVDTGANSNSGEAYVFSAATGAHLLTLANPGPGANDQFGTSVAINDGRIAVGAYRDGVGASDAGAVYLFDAATGNALLSEPILHPSRQVGARFGASVTLSSQIVAVGSYSDNTGASQAGSVFVYDVSSGTLLDHLANPHPAANDLAGVYVASWDGLLAVGSLRDDEFNTNSGAAFVYDLNARLDGLQLIGPNGSLFDLDTSGFGAGQLLQGSDNAFDGLNRLQVDGVDFSPGRGSLAMQGDSDRTLITGTMDVAGLSVYREVTVPDTGSEDFARTIDVFTNSTDEEIIVPVRVVGNLGSDGATTVFATSDGDTIIEPTDTWFGTDDVDGTGAPAIIHLLRNAAGLQPTNIEVIGDNVVWDYLLTIPAGQTRRLAHFTVIGSSQIDAENAVSNLVSGYALAGQSAAFLTDTELASLVNFIVPFAPTALSLSSSSLAENRPAGTSIGVFTSTDQNLADAFAYSLVTGAGDTDNASFTIDGAILKAASSFDFETKNSYAIRVRTTDLTGLSFERSFTINIVDVDEISPRVISSSRSHFGGIAPAGTSALTIMFSESIVGGNVANNFELRSQGADGILGNEDDVLVSLSADEGDRQTEITFDPLAEGIYRLTVSGDIADIAGNLLENGSWSSDFVVNQGGDRTLIENSQLLGLGANMQQANAGRSVAVDGNIAVVGLPGSAATRESTRRSGAAYILHLNDNGTTTIDDDTWETVAILGPSDAQASDYFGTSVSISGDTVVVGSNGEDDRGYDAGAAYVFTAPSGGWSAGASSLLNESAKLVASDAAAYDNFGIAVSISGDTVVVGSDRNDDQGSDSGSAYVFVRPVGGWTGGAASPQFESAKLMAADASANDRFGVSASISGDTIVVGSSGDDDGGSASGSAYVFHEPTGGWAGGAASPLMQSAKLVASDASTSDNFGFSVSISGDVVVVGSVGDDEGGNASGAAYVFTVPVGGWSASGSTSLNEAAKLVASDAGQGDYFGYSVSISGDVVVVGSIGDDEGGYDSGSAYVFSMPFGGWSGGAASPRNEMAKLVASDASAGDRFGYSVSISGESIVIGSLLDDAPNGDRDLGSAFLFTEPMAGWSGGATSPQTEFLKWAPVFDETLIGDAGAQFGSAVAVDGDFAVVGAPYDDFATGSLSGAAYVYDISGSVLRHVATLIPSTPVPNDYFGISVSISGDTVVVGSSGDDGGGYESGAAYVFSAPTGGWGMGDGSRQTETTKLVASDSAVRDRLGNSVSISGNTIVVGSFGQAYTYYYTYTCGGGINPRTCGGSYIINNDGAAYVYTAPAGGWSTVTDSTRFETAKLIASDANNDDEFGSTVAISGDTVVVGSYLDDDAGSASGSAYVFTKPIGGWSGGASVPQQESAKLTASDAIASDYFGTSVSISGDVIVIGSYGDDNGGGESGAAYVFTVPAGGWSGSSASPLNESAKLVALDSSSFDRLGVSVSISGATVVVGSYQDDAGGFDSGSAYVFTEPIGGWAGGAAAPFKESAKLLASDAAPYDSFGYSVSISGDKVVVGSYRDDHGGSDAGSSYVITEPTNGWSDFASVRKLQSTNFELSIDEAAFGSGQLLFRKGNAINALNRLQVNDVAYYSASTTKTTMFDGGQTVVLSPAMLSGLSVSREITVPDIGSEDFARTIDVFTNPTGSDITVPVRIVGNLGSDAATTVFASSDGDNIVESTDTWFGTDDADGTGTPAIVHLLRSEDGIQPTYIDVIGDNIVWDYQLTIPAGQTVRLAHFTILATTQADAITAANALVASTGFAGQAGAFLDQQELTSLANFVFVRDFGDAPLPYPGSASHLPVGPTLGATRDDETGIQRSANADGDGADEDGVTFGTMQVGELGTTVTVNVAGGVGLLDAWIDFNGDGDWADAGEQIATSLEMVEGDNLVTVDVPAWAVAGETFARFRLSSSGGLTTDDVATDGEVEDYQLTIAPDTVPTITLATDSTSPTNAASFEVLITANEVVTGLELSADLSVGDIRISPAATTTATLVQVDSKTYRLTVTPTVDGTVTVQVVGDAAFDGANNGNEASEIVSIEIDRTTPLPVFTALQSNPTHLNPFRVAVDFGETVTTLDIDDLTITGGVISNLTTSDDRIYTFDVTAPPFVDVTIGLLSEAVSDLAGNLSLAAEPLVVATIAYDFGDAPAPYPTLLADDGAAHVAQGPRLGATVDYEADGQPSDDAQGDGSDEKGVTFGLIKLGNAQAAMTVQLQNASTARLDAWIDFNADGVWDASERIFDNTPIYAGSQTLNYIVPATAAVGETYARIRVSSTGGLLPTGPASDGEVEDYRVLITEDVTIDLPASTSNDVTLRSTGTHVQVVDNLNNGAVLASAEIATTRSLTIQGGQLDDVVRVDFAAGGFFSVPDGVTIADPHGNDHLIIHGTGSTRATYISRDSVLGDAVVLLRQGTSQSLIRFTGMEPLDISGMQTFSVQGALNVGSETLTIDSALRPSLDELTTIEGGTIRSATGLALGSGEILRGFGTIDAPFAAENGSTVSLIGDMTIGRESSVFGFDSRGEVNVGGNKLTLLDANQAVLGSITVLGTDSTDGTIVSSRGLLLDFGNNLVGRGTLATPDDILLPTMVNGAIIGNGEDAGIILEGYIKGIGSLDYVEIAGTYSPGFSPARVTVGSLTYSSRGRTIFELGGTTPGSEHDQIVHQGTAKLGGQLIVELINGFQPSIRNEFVLIIASNGITGEFNSISLPPVPDGTQWELVYEANAVRLVLTQRPDVTPPTAVISSLPLTWNSQEIPLTILLDDPEGGPGEPVSGVASYDVYVAIDNGAWTLWHNDVPASQTQLIYQAEPDRRYWFRAVATDLAGNVEIDSGLAETNTRVLDFAAPVTQADSVSVNDSTGQITIRISGADVGSAGLKEFQVWVAIDGAEPVPVVGSPIAAGSAVNGVHSIAVVYQGLRDGREHKYRFFSVGVDKRANIEATPAEPLDVEVTGTFAAPTAMQATGIDVQSGETQRSYVTHLDLLFNDTTGLSDLIANSRLRLERFSTSATNVTPGTGTVVDAWTASVAGNSIRLDFGTGGLGGAASSGNGFYRIMVDIDGDSEFDDANFEFFRLFGDANGDGVVNTDDERVTGVDINGDGRFDARDRRDIRSARGNYVDAALLSLIDD